MFIYLPAITPRTKYVFDFIFVEELGIEYKTTADINAFEKLESEKLNYSEERISGGLFIKAHSLLSEKNIKKTEVLLNRKNQNMILFDNDVSCDLGFDIFSAVFYMVSRYEEYLPFDPDKYGRYPATNSLAFKNNCLHVPVVNIWIEMFKNLLLKKYPSLTFKTTNFRSVITYDIDVAYAFKGRSITRNLAAITKDVITLKVRNLAQRIRTLLNLQKDPWDVYSYLQETISSNKSDSIFFFLLGGYSQHNKNVSPKHPLMKELVKKVSSFSEIGIHPSFKTYLNPQKIIIEKEKLEKLSNKKITKSRQHFLKFSLPDTYNYLIDAGIKEEYSMCFADSPGFRAGTCKPFYFYDLKNERSTALKIFPVTFMEGTFIDYMKSSPSPALHLIQNLMEQVKKVNGTFISIWHNHTISETNTCKPWRDVHNKMIEEIASHK